MRRKDLAALSDRGNTDRPGVSCLLSENLLDESADPESVSAVFCRFRRHIRGVYGLRSARDPGHADHSRDDRHSAVLVLSPLAVSAHVRHAVASSLSSPHGGHGSRFFPFSSASIR